MKMIILLSPNYGVYIQNRTDNWTLTSLYISSSIIATLKVLFSSLMTELVFFLQQRKYYWCTIKLIFFSDIPMFSLLPSCFIYSIGFVHRFMPSCILLYCSPCIYRSSKFLLFYALKWVIEIFSVSPLRTRKSKKRSKVLIPKIKAKKVKSDIFARIIRKMNN